MISASACSNRHPIGDVRVSGLGAGGDEDLGISPSELDARLRTALEANGHFRLLPAGSREARDAASLSFELAFARESQAAGEEGNAVEVGAVLAIRRKIDGIAHRYELTALGRAPLADGGARVGATRAAVDRALEQLAEAANIQLRALSRSDVELLREVRTATGQVREAAIRVLSHRGNREVADVLIARLRPSEDPDVVRQAIGALSEMRERRAVQPMIDLTRGKEPGFVREVLFAVAHIGGEEAAAWLFTVAQGHDDEALREVARRALAEMESTSKGETR
ncbi:MAG TPA: HEAT repeat domain-containing protein [Myxococcaceae bacterium]|nr:HEAT repeat domain-containing protein [Myxococcaceae bacterium]